MVNLMLNRTVHSLRHTTYSTIRDTFAINVSALVSYGVARGQHEHEIKIKRIRHLEVVRLK